jgi:hypothetical protein
VTGNGFYLVAVLRTFRAARRPRSAQDLLPEGRLEETMAGSRCSLNARPPASSTSFVDDKSVFVVIARLLDARTPQRSVAVVVLDITLGQGFA